jgi:single-stranded DNA-binding protein
MGDTTVQMSTASMLGFVARSAIGGLGNAGEAAAEYLAKAWLVAVDGWIEFGQWQTESGEKRHEYTVVGDVEFLTAPRPVGEPEQAKATRGKKEPVAA